MSWVVDSEQWKYSKSCNPKELIPIVLFEMLKHLSQSEIFFMVPYKIASVIYEGHKRKLIKNKRKEPIIILVLIVY